ncbi:MAG: HDOD domain-containing protein [Pseudomonadota bacterium]
MSDRVKEILSKVERLPALPGVAQQVMAMLQDPNFSMDRLMRTVRLDPGITAHVIEMCNSPYYALRQKVSSLQQALVILGSRQLMEILLSGQLVGKFRQRQLGYRLARGDLWRHSMATALLAQHLGELLKFEDQATLFTAALMHDVGKLVLSEYVAQDFARIEALVAEGQSFAQAEQTVLGVDHALLGGAVVRKWNFPDEIAAAIAFHHNPERSQQHRKLCHLVCLANLMCVTLGVGAGAEGLASTFSAELLREVGLKPRQLDVLLLDLKDILDQAADLLALAA